MKLKHFAIMTFIFAGSAFGGGGIGGVPPSVEADTVMLLSKKDFDSVLLDAVTGEVAIAGQTFRTKQIDLKKRTVAVQSKSSPNERISESTKEISQSRENAETIDQTALLVSQETFDSAVVTSVSNKDDTHETADPSQLLVSQETFDSAVATAVSNKGDIRIDGLQYSVQKIDVQNGTMQVTEKSGQPLSIFAEKTPAN
jgi:hypothetical protein